MANDSQVVLVTGAGSGFGLETALLLAERGWRVFGSVLTEAEGAALQAEAGRRGLTVDVVRMDVTKEEQVRATVDAMVARTGRIDACVQFAGMGLRGFFEDLGIDEVKRVYDVNVFGAILVTQAVLAHMRPARRGRVLITSSAAGRMGAMGISGYCSSKHALSGLVDCLRQEVRPLNIWVSLLEPGLVLTPHFTVNRNRARKAVLPSSPYYKWFCQHEKIVDDLMARNSFGVRDVAEVAYGALTAAKPKQHYMVGFKPKLLVALRRYLPGDLFDALYWPVVRRMVTQPKVQATGLSGLDLQSKGHTTE